MRTLKNRYTFSLLGALAAVLFTACSEWTEVESLDIHNPSLGDQNPELYQQYLVALRAYKASEHKIMLATFENHPTTPSHRNQHLAGLPDSLDFVSLNNPSVLHPMIVEEMAAVREKGTRLVYEIDYAKIEKRWQEILEEEEAQKPEQPETTAEGDVEGDDPTDDPTDALEARFIAFCQEQTAAQLALCDEFGYDGAIVSYTGRAPQAMQPDELERYEARQQAFLGSVATWREQHADRVLFFQGSPQNLLDKTLLGTCDYIVIPVPAATSTDEMSYAVQMALTEGVPSDRFVIGVKMPSVTDPSDETGLFPGFEADGTTRVRAVKGAAQWAAAPSANYVRAGVSVAGVENDYFNTTLVYRNVREAIDTMNPTPKN